MILEPNTYRQLSNEITFVDQRITDYFSPKGNFPEEMHLSKELGDTACRIPQGYTEQEVRDLLLAVSCSDDCMDQTTVSGSTSSAAFEDPRRNAIVNQVGMMMTNSLTIDDFSRQRGISEAYLNGRKKYNELVSQLEQGNTAELRKLVSSGIKNMILSDRTLGRKVSAKAEAYAVNRTLEMAMELLEKHPDLRDPEILNEEDMEDFRIFRGRSAFYKDAHATSGRLLEKLNRGEDLTEEEIAEVIFFNQVQGDSEKFELELETYFEQEILKEFTLPGGLPMPIGQNLVQLEMMSYRLELSKTIPLGKFAGTGELKEYTDKIREKVQEIRTAGGYSDFTRAICIGYPQSKQKLLEKVRQSEYFKQVIEQVEQVRRKKASDEKEQAGQEEDKLRNKMDELTSQGVFSGDDIDALLASEGIPKKQIKYDAKVNPENKEYVEALEAQRNGVDLKTDEGWQKIFAQQKQEIERRANALAPLNKDHKAFNTLSYRAIGEFRGSSEAWLKKMVEANAYDPMTELLRSYPGQVFTLDENGQRVILNPAGGDLREMETGCLKAGEENGLYLMAPPDSEKPGAIFGMTFQRNMNSSPEILPIDQYLERLNQVTMPKKPSWFVRLFAFLIPGFREEVLEYKREWNERQQERAKAEKITENMRKLRSQPASAWQEQNPKNSGMSPESVEKLKKPCRRLQEDSAGA